MEKLIDDLDKKISKAQNITGNLFDDLRGIRISFNRLKAAINYTRCCEELCEEYLQPELDKYKNIKVERTKGRSDI